MHGETPLTLLTLPEAARVLRIREGRAYDLARKGLLPGVVRIGRSVRIDENRLREWLQTGGTTLPAEVSGSRTRP